MAAPSGITQSFNTKLWSYALDSTKSETTIEAALAIATNEIVEVTEMGIIETVASVIDVSTFGRAFINKLAGQVDLGTFDFTASFDASNAKHIAIRDDVKSGTESTYVVEITKGADKVYCAFDAFLVSASVDPSDSTGVVNMAVSVVLTGTPVYVDNS